MRKLKEGIKKWFRVVLPRITVAILVFIIWTLMAFSISLTGLTIWIYAIASAVITILLIKWFRKNIIVLGEKDPKCVALKTIFGEPKNLIGFGLIGIWWPFEKLWLVPTGAYWWSYEMKARTKDGIWLNFKLRINWRYPINPKNLEQKYHFPKDTHVSLKGEVVPSKDTADIPKKWEEKSSEELLHRAYSHLPNSPLKLGWQDLMEMFRNSIEGSAVHAVGQMTRKELEEHQDWAEAEIKILMLQESGDIPHDIGTPSEVLDIRFTLIEVEEEVRKAIYAYKIAEHKGEAHKIAGEKRKEAAADHAEADRIRIQALTDKGVDSTTAAVLMSGTGEKDKGKEKAKSKLDILEQMAVIHALGGMNPAVKTVAKTRKVQKRSQGRRQQKTKTTEEKKKDGTLIVFNNVNFNQEEKQGKRGKDKKK